MSDPIIRLNAALEGRYRIERQLGEGGMATVYLARDAKHNRNVALKVLKPELAAVVGAGRFLAEIKTTANLQHPHILPLFDSGQADGMLFYVMPHVEGESLRERLDREHQLPVEEAVRITTNVAEALEYAHARGVIHRDIKPANILLQAGKPLVSDFGIALAVSAGGGGRLTETGLSLGTPHYMSPEQATGDMQVGPATDIYALGCVLYEMLVGEPPHTGSTPQAILGKIIAGEGVSATKQRATVPAHVDAAIRKALEKVPADRFRSANEFADVLSGRLRLDSAETTARLRSSSRWVAGRRVAATVGIALIAFLAARTWPREVTNDGQVVRMVFTLPEDQRLGFGAANSLPVVISPDGRTIVYVAELESGTQMMLRPIDAFAATPIPGTTNATQPFFSPDGRQIGFVAGRALRRVGLDGGAPLTITQLDGAPHGASWGDDGRIVFSIDGRALLAVPAGGGEPVAMPLVRAPDGETPGDTLRDAEWPQVLPGSRRVIFGNDDGTWLADLTTGEARLVAPGGVALSRYLQSGHLMLAEGAGLVRLLPFDLKKMTATGIASTPLDGVGRGQAGGAGAIAVSDNGTAVYAGGVPGVAGLVVVDRSGRETPIPLQVSDLRWPRLSPDGSQVLLFVGPTNYLVDLGRSGADPIPAVRGVAVWSPDGQRLVSRRDDSYSDLVEHRLDRPGEPRRIGPGPPPTSRFGFWPEDWSTDGRRVIGVVTSFSGRSEIRVLELGRDSVPALVLETNGYAFSVQWSPDGNHFTYMSDETGTFEVYAAGYPEPGRPVRVTSGGGQDPRWTDREIIYRNGHRVMAVDVRTDPALEFGEPRELFRGDYNFQRGAENWDVTRDGQRFVMIKGDPAVTRELKVVVNWFAELSPGTGR